MEEIKKLTIPDGWEFDRIDGDNIVLKEKKGMPKTWEESYMTVEAEYIRPFRSESAVPVELVSPMFALCQLLICRAAWWKQLGWKPDWADGDRPKFCIYSDGTRILRSENKRIKTILAFPTPQIRDLFYESFRGLLEEAKELL